MKLVLLDGRARQVNTRGLFWPGLSLANPQKRCHFVAVVALLVDPSPTSLIETACARCLHAGEVIFYSRLLGSQWPT